MSGMSEKVLLNAITENQDRVTKQCMQKDKNYAKVKSDILENVLIRNAATSTSSMVVYQC